jgi:hypothetical protein
MLICATLVLLVTRIAILPFSPPGFYQDEAGSGANVRAMLAHGTDFSGQHHRPLFFWAGGTGYYSPVYIYPLTLWAKLYGSGEFQLRYFSEVATLLGIAFLALAVRYWFGTWFAWLQAVVALALPWGWLQGSLAWDAALIPMFMGLTVLCASVLLFSTKPVHRRIAAVGLPAALVTSMYDYSPCRASAPLLAVTIYFVLRRHRVLSKVAIAAAAGSAAVLAFPLAEFLRQPAARSRATYLSVFHGTSFGDGVRATLRNLLGLLDPRFLFIHGDPNLRHSTGYQGMLGAVSIIPAIALIVFLTRSQRGRSSVIDTVGARSTTLILISVTGAVLGLLSSALTNEGQPHSLRATSAWPFLAILLALGWWTILQVPKRRSALVCMLVFAAGTTAYAADLAGGYRARSADAFDVGIRKQISDGGPTAYPPYALTYYR